LKLGVKLKLLKVASMGRDFIAFPASLH